MTDPKPKPKPRKRSTAAKKAAPTAVVQTAAIAPREVVEPQVVLGSEPTVYCMIGCPFGDLEYDVGKSARWMEYFSDRLYALDVNMGEPRYWIINWTLTFPDSDHSVTRINYFEDPVAFRKEQFARADALYHMDNSAWIMFVDASEGLSFDNSSLPNDYAFNPFMSWVYREITRAEAVPATSVVLPFFVFLRSGEIQNVTYGTPTPGVPAVLQPISVPYYFPYKGLRRLFRVDVLRSPSFDWTTIDTPVDWTVQPGTGTQQIDGYLSLPGSVSTPDTPDMTISSGNIRLTLDCQVDAIGAGYPTLLTKLTPGRELYVYLTANRMSFSTDGPTATADVIMTNTGVGARRSIGIEYTVGSTAGTAIVDGVRTGVTFPQAPIAGTSTGPLTIGVGAAGTTVRIYGAKLEKLDAGGAVTELVWQFNASDYPGTGTSYADPRGRTWTLSGAGVITPKVAAIPAVPTVKAQIVSYAYARYSQLDIPPGATEVPVTTEKNDDGFRMRQRISQVRPIPGLPLIWSSADPAGVPGPWAIGTLKNTHPNFTAITDDTPSTPNAAAAGVMTPLYDTVFRLNLRDGVWYEGAETVEGSTISGNTPLTWNPTTQKWMTAYDPAAWVEEGVDATFNPTFVPPPTPT